MEVVRVAYHDDLSPWSTSYVRTQLNPQSAKQPIRSNRLDKRRTKRKFHLTSRIGNAAYRCGNVPTDTEIIFIFVSRLLPVLQPIVERYRREHPRYELKFTHIVSYTRDQGYLYRAPEKKTAVSSIFPTKKPRLASANSTGVIRTKDASRPATRLVVPFSEAKKSPLTSDDYYVKKRDRSVEVFHAAETENEQETVQESINTEYLPSTAYLSKSGDTV